MDALFKLDIFIHPLYFANISVAVIHVFQTNQPTDQPAAKLEHGLARCADSELQVSEGRPGSGWCAANVGDECSRSWKERSSKIQTSVSSQYRVVDNAAMAMLMLIRVFHVIAAYRTHFYLGPRVCSGRCAPYGQDKVTSTSGCSTSSSIMFISPFYSQFNYVHHPDSACWGPASRPLGSGAVPCGGGRLG